MYEVFSAVRELKKTEYGNVHIKQLETTPNKKSEPNILVMVCSLGNHYCSSGK